MKNYSHKNNKKRIQRQKTCSLKQIGTHSGDALIDLVQLRLQVCSVASPAATLKMVMNLSSNNFFLILPRLPLPFDLYFSPSISISSSFLFLFTNDKSSSNLRRSSMEKLVRTPRLFILDIVTAVLSCSSWRKITLVILLALVFLSIQSKCSSEIRKRGPGVTDCARSSNRESQTRANTIQISHPLSYSEEVIFSVFFSHLFVILVWASVIIVLITTQFWMTLNSRSYTWKIF